MEWWVGRERERERVGANELVMVIAISLDSDTKCSALLDGHWRRKVVVAEAALHDDDSDERACGFTVRAELAMRAERGMGMMCSQLFASLSRSPCLYNTSLDCSVSLHIICKSEHACFMPNDVI